MADNLSHIPFSTDLETNVVLEKAAAAHPTLAELKRLR